MKISKKLTEYIDNNEKTDDNKKEINMCYAIIREFKKYKADLEYLFYTDSGDYRNALNSAISLTSKEIERVGDEIKKLKEG